MLPLHVTLSAHLGFKEPSTIKASYKPSPDFISPETIAYDIAYAVRTTTWEEVLSTVEWTITADNEQYSGQMEAVRRLIESEILLKGQGDKIV